MTEATLLIDQGNTRLKWVLSGNGELFEESAGRGNAADFMETCRSGSLGQPAAILLSSVAGAAAVEELAGFCKSLWGLEVRRLQSAGQGGGVRNGYADPETLGIDRWLAIIGAVTRYGTPVVIWDLGTATTLDAVDETGQHVGGMIYPGPATMLRALARDTKLKVPEQLSGAGMTPGRSTTACIENGVFAAQLGALNQFLRNLPGAAGGNPKIIVTGGAAGEVLPQLDFPHTSDPWLVFRGMLSEETPAKGATECAPADS
jgi:type III pantothenate kinase